MCSCEGIGQGIQPFRIRRPGARFAQVADLGPAYPELLAGRKVWQCRECGKLFALLRIPFKDEEDILVRPQSEDWAVWDWSALARLAQNCRWSGPNAEQGYVL